MESRLQPESLQDKLLIADQETRAAQLAFGREQWRTADAMQAVLDEKSNSAKLLAELDEERAKTRQLVQSNRTSEARIAGLAVENEQLRRRLYDQLGGDKDTIPAGTQLETVPFFCESPTEDISVRRISIASLLNTDSGTVSTDGGRASQRKRKYEESVASHGYDVPQKRQKCNNAGATPRLDSKSCSSTASSTADLAVKLLAGPTSTKPPTRPQRTVAVPPATNSLRLGVYTSDELGRAVTKPLDCGRVPQSVVDAVRRVVIHASTVSQRPGHASAQRVNRANIRGGRPGTCVYQRRMGNPTAQYYDHAGNGFVAEVACRSCTFERRPCVRVAGGDYDVVLAPLAQQYREGVLEHDVECFVWNSRAADETVGCFYQKTQAIAAGLKWPY